MGELRKITVDLDDAASATLDELVASGRFPDAATVLRFGLALIVEHDVEGEELWQATVRSHGIERLRASIDEAMVSDPVEIDDDFFEDVKRRGRERMAQARAAE